MSEILNFDLTGEKVITNEDLAFKDTVYEKLPFKIFIKMLSNTKAIALAIKHKIEMNSGNEKLTFETLDRFINYNKEIWMTEVVSWEGFYSSGTLLSCTKESKESLYERVPEFCNLVVKAISEKRTEQEKLKEEEKKI